MIRYIIYTTVALLFAASCSKESSPTIEQEEVRSVAFSMMTKAGGESRSYCFALYTSDQNVMSQYGFYTTEGIVSSVDGRYSWLKPIVANENLGLAASVGTYTMSAVSPAVAPTSADSYLGVELTKGSKVETITRNIYGYPYHRVPVDNNAYDNLFIGAPANIYIEGVLASTGSDETAYNYTFEDSYTLKQQRTKFQLKARAGFVEDDDGNKTQLSYDMGAIYITDVVNSVLFNPTVGYYATEVVDLYPFADFQGDGDESLINKSESTALQVIEDENIDKDNNFYLISADYSDRDKYPIAPTLNVEFKNGSGSVRTVAILLDIDFKPQYYYTFDLLINSVEITLSIDVEDWEGHDVPDEEVGDITKHPITVSIKDDSSWDDGGTIPGGTIPGDIDDMWRR